MAAAWYRPDTDKTVNKCELAGVGLSLIVVCLGLMFTSHREGHVKNDPTDYRYVAYPDRAEIVPAGLSSPLIRAAAAASPRPGSMDGPRRRRAAA